MPQAGPQDSTSDIPGFEREPDGFTTSESLSAPVDRSPYGWPGGGDFPEPEKTPTDIPDKGTPVIINGSGFGGAATPRLPAGVTSYPQAAPSGGAGQSVSTIVNVGQGQESSQTVSDNMSSMAMMMAGAVVLIVALRR